MTSAQMLLTRSAIVASIAALVGACADDVDSLYFNAPARFVFNYANAVPVLNNALNSPGQFCFASCTVGERGYITAYHFANLRSATDYPATQPLSKTNYTSFGGQGFIIGRSSIPALGSGGQELLAFDRICPACYEEGYITRPLQFTADAQVACSRGHSYDLNNQGRPDADTGGRSLYRYRIYYNGSNVVSISN